MKSYGATLHQTAPRSATLVLLVSAALGSVIVQPASALLPTPQPGSSAVTTASTPRCFMHCDNWRFDLVPGPRCWRHHR